MRIAVVGVGGVGGYFGGKLARYYASDQDIEVIFVARGEHFRQIQMNGLLQITEEGQFTAFPTLATDNSENSDLFDLISKIIERTLLFFLFIFRFLLVLCIGAFCHFALL